MEESVVRLDRLEFDLPAYHVVGGFRRPVLNLVAERQRLLTPPDEVNPAYYNQQGLDAARRIP